jgi:pyrophosphatase PpaX
MATKTLLLDLDGTVLDTREFILAAMIHTLASHGIEGPSRADLNVYMGGQAGASPQVAELARTVGLPLEAIYARLWAGDPWQLVETHRTFQSQNLDMVTAFPGAKETLEKIRARGVRLAAVTSRSQRTSVRSVEVAGLGGYFEAVVSAEDTPTLKPDPAPLIHALALLRVGSESAAIAGDTEHDIQAGKAIGIRTIGVSYGFGAEGLPAAKPDVMIDAITELPGAL